MTDPSAATASRPPRAGSPTAIAAWTAASVAGFVVLMAYVRYVVSGASSPESGDALSWFTALLSTPALAAACWWSTCRALRAARRPPPTVPAVEPPTRHASFSDDAGPPPTRW
ncbi:hypothetical protein [Cellulomonas uda]|uniref:hypothetical protein n=1 Tax=Cellulomonas uda TaxID=1714 RepID=UPI001142FE09|nr:hypothetical protein [Cellulomonas uda]NII65758.1 hypothetical protein [Cellulomonas uda]